MAYDEANHRTTENNTYCKHPHFGCGVYAAVSGTFQTPNGNTSGTVTEDSSIKEYLNNTYYPTLNGIAKIQVQSHTFNIGSVQWLNESGNDSIEKNIAGEKMYQWTGNVGLINVSDVLKASTNTACKSASATTEAFLEDPPMEVCGSYLTYFDIINEELEEIGYWTINGFTLESEYGSYNSWFTGFSQGIGTIGDIGLIISSENAGARPVVFLKSSIQFTEGNGSKSNPYIVQ